MARKVRKDNKGRQLRRGECYSAKYHRFSFSYYGPTGKRVYVYAKDLPELRERERQIQRDKLDGLNSAEVASLDLNALFDRYIRTKTTLRHTTKTGYIYTYNHFIRKTFGKKKVLDIKYSDVVLFYNQLVDQGIAVSTVDHLHCVIHPTLQMAVRDNLIRNNPSDGAMSELKKGKKGQRPPRHALTYPQQKQFLDYIDGSGYERWKNLLVFMFGTGVRLGEMLALKWSDLDFENNEIHIRHNLTYKPDCDRGFVSHYSISTPKTKNSIRTIPMLDKVREALLDEKRMQEQTGIKNIMKVDGYSGFVFVGRYGGFHKEGSLNKMLKIVTDGCNTKERLAAEKDGREPLVVPYFSAHVIRHSFCSRLCENGTNIKVIQTIMGHSDIQTTMDIYAEVSEATKQEAFKQLNTKNVL